MVEYSDETLALMQQKLLNIAVAVDRICRDNGIVYYLFRGSLLGAVRHQGFIPWDDDMDIAMPRPDYERFLEIAPGLLPEPFRLRHHSNTAFYPYSFIKVDDATTTVVESSTDFVCGVYLDVFPLDGADHTRSLSARLRRWQLLFYRQLFLGYFGGNDRVFKHERLVRLTKRLLRKTFNIKRWQRRYDRLCKKQAYEDSRQVSFLFYYAMPAFDRQWFGTPASHLFARELLWVPQQADVVLTALYGPDYLALPPQEHRYSFHMQRCLYYALNQGYEDYLAEETRRAGNG